MENQNSFSTKLFEDAYGIVKNMYSKYSKEARIRLFFAYVFKAIAVFGGIVLTTGVDKSTAQFVGIIISAVIACDVIFSNHKRLLIITKASKGLGLFLEDIQFEYNSSLQEIIKLKTSGQQNEVSNKHDQINNDFANRCHERSQEIKKAIIEADLKLLESLAVEKENGKK